MLTMDAGLMEGRVFQGSHSMECVFRAFSFALLMLGGNVVPAADDDDFEVEDDAFVADRAKAAFRGEPAGIFTKQGSP